MLFILGIAVFCALGCVILLGTSAPLLTRLSGNPSQVQTSFYAKTTTPAGFLLVLLLDGFERLHRQGWASQQAKKHQRNKS